MMSHLEEIKKYQEEVRKEVERWVNSGADVNEKNEVSDRQQRADFLLVVVKVVIVCGDRRGRQLSWWWLKLEFMICCLSC